LNNDALNKTISFLDKSSLLTLREVSKSSQKLVNTQMKKVELKINSAEDFDKLVSSSSMLNKGSVTSLKLNFTPNSEQIKCLSQFKKLEYLEMVGSGTTSENNPNITPALRELSSLVEAGSLTVEELELKEYSINAEDINGLTGIMQSDGDSRLKFLNMKECTISSAAIENLANLLSESSLVELNLNQSDIGNVGIESMQVFAKSLKSSQLSGLSMEDMNLVFGDVQALAGGIDGSTIKILSLKNNNIDDRGAQSLAQAMPNSSLEVIDLGSNQIGDLGVVALAEVIAGGENSGSSQLSIREISLEENTFGDRGGLAFVDALPNSKLTSLRMFDNNMSESVKTTIKGCNKNIFKEDIEIEV
jgi:hypothetical protein